MARAVAGKRTRSTHDGTIKAMKKRSNHLESHTKGTRLTATLSLLLTAVILWGCNDSKGPGGSASRASVIIKGSNTIGEELGPRLISEFKKVNPTINVNIETKGSASGYWGLIGGGCDIAAASRAIGKDEQEQAQAHGVTLDDNVIGSYSVAVIVNAACPVADLTRDQIRDIFTGKIQNWKELGGPDAPIHLYVRNPASGTYLGFRELAMEDKPYSTHTDLFTNYQGIAQAVAKDASGIGYCSLQLAGKDGTKALSIGGLAPTPASVKEGKYPFARALHLCTNKGALAPAAVEFVRFVCSSQGQQILDDMGFVPRQ
jgi:phosphate transport system substrate-binding protein